MILVPAVPFDRAVPALFADDTRKNNFGNVGQPTDRKLALLQNQSS
jgi:hypothetical protein